MNHFGKLRVNPFWTIKLVHKFKQLQLKKLKTQTVRSRLCCVCMSFTPKSTASIFTDFCFQCHFIIKLLLSAQKLMCWWVCHTARNTEHTPEYLLNQSHSFWSDLITFETNSNTERTQRQNHSMQLIIWWLYMYIYMMMIIWLYD